MELSKVVNTLDEDFDVENVNDDWSFMFDSLFVKNSVASFRKIRQNTGLLIAAENAVI